MKVVETRHLSTKTHYPVPTELIRIDNGLTIIHMRDHSKLAAVSVVVLAGSAHDEARSGLAHLLEHMLAGGESAGEHPLVAALRERGVTAGAETGFPFQHYFIRGFAADFAAMAKAVWHMAFVPLDLWPDSQLERERSAVLNEIDERRAAWRFNKWAISRFVPKHHPLHADHGGDPVTVRTLNENELRAFHAEHYRLTNSAIVVAGDVDRARMLETIAGLVDHLPRVRHTASAANARPQFDVSLIDGTFHDEHSPTGVEAVFKIPESTRDKYLFSFYGRMIAEGLDAPLMQALRERQPLVYGIHRYSIDQSVPIAIMAMPTKPEHRDVVWETFWKTAEAFPHDTTEFERRKKNLLTALRLQEYATRCNRLAGAFITQLVDDWVADIITEPSMHPVVSAATSDEIIAVAERYFTRTNAARIDVVP